MRVRRVRLPRGAIPADIQVLARYVDMLSTPPVQAPTTPKVTPGWLAGFGFWFFFFRPPAARYRGWVILVKLKQTLS